VGTRFSAPVQTGPGAHPASCTMGTGSFPRVKSSRDVTLAPDSLLVPWSRKSRALPLLPVWAVRPVQSLSACTRVLFTLPYLFPWSVPFRKYSKLLVLSSQHQCISNCERRGIIHFSLSVFVCQGIVTSLFKSK